MIDLYLKEGVKHILDLNAYDHMVYLLALVAGFTIKDWKKVLLLVTAFTIGHTLTLFLSSLDRIKLPMNIIEFLIPLTIMVTAFYALINADTTKKINWKIYAITLFFGLIHGLGFSNQFKALMGKSTRLTEAVFGFNIGVELGQMIIVLIVLLVSFLAVKTLGLKQYLLRRILATSALLIAIILTIKTWPF